MSFVSYLKSDRGHNLLFKVSIALICLILFALYNFLSLGSYHVPFGVSVDQLKEQIVVKRYSWNGQIDGSYRYEGDKEQLSQSVQRSLILLPVDFKRAFATIITIIISAIVLLYIKIGSSRWKLNSAHPTFRSWSGIVPYFVIGVYLTSLIFAVLEYQNLIQETEELISLLKSIEG
ncbi:hypothetical protein [Halobacillus litoralis]|uniref:hypothetical protein n=1 Tax=Halobacillus litoralis TaxID=45668 RepID=UPI001CFED851|nr:hypothetical protein [Halobacillus litoralis]